MASYTTSLRLVQPATGEYSGTWGTQVNTGLTALVDTSIAGTASITMTATNYTLSNNNGASDEARAMFLVLGGTPGASYQVICPAVSKLYFVTNSTGHAQTVKTSAGSGISVPNGASMTLRCNGTDVVVAQNYFGSLTLGAALPVASGGTGAATLTGYVKGAGTSAFTASATIPVADLSGTLPVGNGGTGATTLTGVLKGNGASAFSAATAGTDFVAPGTATTFTAKQTFTGSTSVLASKLVNALETVTISATAATGTINYDVTTQSVLYYTTNASANWTVNFRASGTTSLDTAMATGESVTVAFLVTQGATAYYNSAVQVDGASVTPKWQGGSAPTAGNASSIDVYTYTIIKTGAAAFTVLAAQTRFA
jgi:hypothetical protein